MYIRSYYITIKLSETENLYVIIVMIFCTEHGTKALQRSGRAHGKHPSVSLLLMKGDRLMKTSDPAQSIFFRCLLVQQTTLSIHVI
jgi:hypothetical protein